jgi:hypothetical protein
MQFPALTDQFTDSVLGFLGDTPQGCLPSVID